MSSRERLRVSPPSSITHRRMTEAGNKGVRVSRYYPGLSVNGKLVHLACGPDGDPACRADIDARYRVRGRITCKRCAARFPRRALLHSHKPLVVGLDWSPFYDSISEALNGGATKMPKIKGPGYLPVFG